MIPIVLVGILTAGAALDGETAEQPAAASVVRTYDLGPLKTYGLGEASWSLAPALNTEAAEDLDQDGWNGFESDTVVDLIQEEFPDQFDYADRALWMRSHDELVVRAPEALQERVARLIAGIESASLEHADLRVDVVTLPTARLAGRDWRGVVGTQVAAELRELAGSDASRRTHRLSLYPGRPAVADLRREHQVMLDYNVEIAQGAAIHDPVVATMSLGTRLLLSAAPGRDGLALSYIVTHADPLDGPQRRSQRSRIFVSGESYAEHWSSAQAWQSIEAVTRGTAGAAQLAPGTALVLRSDLELAGVKNSEFVVIEQVGGGLSASHDLSAASERGLVLVNSQALTPPHCRLAGYWTDQRWPHARRPAPIEWDDEDLWFGAQLERGDADVAVEMIATSSTGLMLDESSPWVVGLPDPDAIRELEDAGARVGTVAQVLDEYAPHVEMVDLHVVVRRGGRDGARVASCVLPVQVGRECVAAMVREQLSTSEVDVEVAQNAAAADPVVRVDFEGLLLWARPHRSSTGALVLDLAGEARAQVARGGFELDSPLIASVDLATFDRLAFDERLALTPGGEPVVLTESAGEGGGAALTLEVSVR